MKLMTKNLLFLYLRSTFNLLYVYRCSNEDPYHSNQLSDLKVWKTERKEFNQRPINYYQIDDEDKIMAGQSTKFLNKYNTHNDFESVNPLETPQVEEKVVQSMLFYLIK